MIVLVQANVLTIGINGRNQTLQKLPIQLLTVRTGAKAAKFLKNKNIDGVISNWNLEDMKDGWFIRNLRVVKPHIPTIVFVSSKDQQQEIKARSFGVSAVLTEDASDDLFRQTVANVLGLKDVISIKTISPADIKKRRYHKIIR